MEEKIVDKYKESVGDEPIKEEAEGVEPIEKIPETKEGEKTRAALEAEGQPSRESEKTRAVLEAEEQPSGGSSVTPVIDDKAPHRKKVEEIKKLSKEEQVKALCNLAVEKDVDSATEVAKGLDDAYILDEFHDELDKLDLIKKGKLKEL